MKRPDIKISPRSRKVGLWSIGIFVAIGVLGFLAAPPLVRYFAEKKLTELLHRQVTIERVRINPYAMSATVAGFDMKERDGASSALRFDELAVNLEVESLFRGGFVLEEIRLANPALQIVRNADGRYNFSDVIEEILKQPKSDEPTHFSLNNIRLTGGRVDFDDRLLKAKHAVTQIDIGVPFVSNLPSQVEIKVQPTFSAKVDGAPLSLGGSATPFADTRQAVVKLDVDALELPKYIAYSPLPLNFKMPSGRLDTRLTLTFTQPTTGAPSAFLAGDAGLKQVEITEKGGAPLVKLPLLAVKLQSADIFGGKFVVANVRLDHPEVWLAREGDGGIRLVKALSPAAAGDDKKAEAAPPAKPASAAKPVVFSLAELHLAEGKIHFADAAVAPQFSTDIAALNLVAKNLGNAPKQAGTVEADLQTAAGEAIRHSGSVTLSPLAAQGHVEVAQAAIPRYTPYYGAFLPMRIEDGTLDVAADYSAALAEGNLQFTASKLDLAVKALKLRQPSEKADFFQLAQFAVKDAAIDLAKRSVVVAAVETSGGKLQLRRDKDGSMDLMRMLPAEESKSAGEPAKAAPETAAAPWDIQIGKFNADAYGVRFDDHTLAHPKTVTVEPIQLAAEKVSSKLSEPIALKFKAGVNKRGSMSAEGSVAPEPLKAALKLDVRNIELMPLQPYVADKLTITLTKGALSTRGKLDVARSKSGALSASFRGNAGINDLRMLDSANATDFLVWKSLFFDGIRLASIEPLKLDIAKVALTSFYSRLILSGDGRFNLQQVVRQPEGEGAPAAPTPAASQSKAAAAPADNAGKAGAEPAAAPVAPPNYKITVQQLTLQNGRVNFSDFFVKPNYSADIRQLGGRVAGLSSDLGTTADVELRGEVSDAPLEILGKINPLSGNLFLDLKASAQGIELPQFTPYSSKYAGYAIEKGKLSVDLAYKVENRKLEAQNGVFLDQLTFGDKVESPDATKLPVLLAVSLLKNRRGEIDVKLPVGGSLDDPQFSVGGVIIQVIVNLIAKAVTAPFALLGSMFGGGEELAYVEYDYGLSDITEAAQKKLDILAKALNDRPGLKLEITGRIDPAKDREGVKKAVVERKVRAQKLAELAKKGESAESLDEVEVGKDEYAKYLERAYKQEKFPKPRNLIGLAKSIPVPEMEKLMLANAPASDDDLRQLAEERAAAVKEYLVDTGKVPAERVFLLAPKLTAAEAKRADRAKEKAKLSRADFSLK